MKKAVVTILLVLPFILIVMISFSARIVSNYQFIGVESLCLIKDESSCYKENDTINLQVNDEYDLSVKVYPEFATNKNVKYSSSNLEVLEVDDLGHLKALTTGMSVVKVTSVDNRDVSININILIGDDYVKDISLNKTVLELNPKQTYQLIATITPAEALNKEVHWSSTNPLVAVVDNNGMVRAISKGETDIIATSVDGEKQAICRVTVKEEIDFGIVDYPEGRDYYLSNTQQVNLESLLIYNPEVINREDITYVVTFGSYISLEGGVVTLIENQLIRVEVRVKNTDYLLILYLKYVI